MSQVIHPAAPILERRLSPTLWRVAGALAIAHVVVLFAGFSQERTPSGLGSTAAVQDTYGAGSLAHILTGGYIESLSFLVLLPALLFVARAYGRLSEGGRWAAQTSLAAGIGYVAVTLATGMPAGAAALYGVQHGASLDTALMVNNVRIFAYYTSLLLLAVQAVGLGVAAVVERRNTRWVGVGGVLTGVLLLLGVAGAGHGLHDYASMVWMIWWIGVGVQLIRNASRPAVDPSR